MSDGNRESMDHVYKTIDNILTPQFERKLLRERAPLYGGDLRQRVALRAWKGLKNFRGDSSFRTWIFRIVVNEAHAMRELHAFDVGYGQADEGIVYAKKNGALPGSIGEPRDPFHTTYFREAVEYLPVALRRIGEEFASVVLLFGLQECSYKKAAEKLDIPIGTVRSRRNRGIHDLREKFTRYGF